MDATDWFKLAPVKRPAWSKMATLYIMVGGFGMTGNPVHLLHALAETELKNLTYILTELMPGATLAEVQAKTEANFAIQLS